MLLTSSRSVEKTVFHSTVLLGPVLELKFLLLRGVCFKQTKRNVITVNIENMTLSMISSIHGMYMVKYFQ